MRSRVGVFLFVLVVATAFIAPVFAPTARAAMDMPAWRAGDYWEYDITGEVSPQPDTTGTMRLEVRGTESVTVQGISYPSYRCNLTFSLSLGSLTLNIPGDAWFRTSDLAPVKMTFTMTIVISPVSTFTVAATVTYNPPPEIEWPLGATSQWSVSSVVTTVTDITGQPPTTETSTLSATYRVDPEESRTVPAGTFTVTPATRTDSGSGDYTRQYWSRDAGNTVEERSFAANDTERGSTKLKSYRYTPPAPGGGNILGLPPILWALILVIIVVAVVAAVAMRRRRPRAPTPYLGVPPTTPQAPTMPPQPPGAPPPP